IQYGQLVARGFKHRSHCSRNREMRTRMRKLSPNTYLFFEMLRRNLNLLELLECRFVFLYSAVRQMIVELERAPFMGDAVSDPVRLEGVPYRGEFRRVDGLHAVGGRLARVAALDEHVVEHDVR